MSNEYRNNHYVPQWYQKRFIPPEQRDQELYYLELKPRAFIDPRGVIHQIDPLHKQGRRLCFVEKDLYTRQFGIGLSTDIEKIFFGNIDRNGRKAIEYFHDFAHPSVDHDAFAHMMLYLSTQKLRTPKGLGWISEQYRSVNQTQLLNNMLALRRFFCAIWVECVWQIADASQSETKFIISDHPITIYNRKCGPRNSKCRGFNDPEIWLQGSHTIFPLSSEKVLILTNLSWVRNPYQSSLNIRPNPTPLRDAVFNYMNIQTMRHLSEQEVREINFVIKQRAFQYVAAGKEDWLYPERYVSKSDWNTYGNGYLFMPDPRAVHMGGEIFIGHNDGTSSAFDEYGRRPWQSDYSQESRTMSEFETLESFKGEFARLFGSYRRGRAFNAMRVDPEQDSEDFHQYHLGLDVPRGRRHPR